MKGIISLSSSLIDADEFSNFQYDDIHLSVVQSNNFLPADIVLILMNLVENVGYNAAYDIIKQCVSQVYSIISHKKHKPASFHLKLSYNGNEISCDINTSLTDDQRDKLIDAVAQKILSL